MRTLPVILLILSFSAFGQKFPVILDPLEPNGNLSTIHMIQGGFEIIGISDNFETFRPETFDNINYRNDSVTHSHAPIIYDVDEVFDTTSITIDLVFDDEIPPNEQPPPPPTVTEAIKPYSFGSGLLIRVDTSQIISIPDYTDNAIVNLHGGESVREIYESELDFLDKYYSPSTNMVEGYPVLIENISDSIWNIDTQEGWVFMIQEAKNDQGEWKPIEYIDYRAVCGNSFWSEKLLPSHYLISKIYRYDGEFRTKLRVRFVTENQIFISNEFVGMINPSQFEAAEFLPLVTDNINEHFLKD
tara:strand:+ start:57 stop:959 length:903 start_codon:yes stop_codon:yes gene_type:complete